MKNPKIRFIDDNIDWISNNFKNIYIKASEGGTPSTTVDAFYEKGTIPFVKIEDTEQKYIEKVNNFINELGLKNSSAWLVPENSLIFTNGATVGNVAINKIPVSTKQGILSIILKQNFDIEFLYYILSSKKFQKEVNMRKTKGTFETIILKYLDEIKIKFPTIAIQNKVSSLLSDIDKKISSQEILIQKLKDTKSSLLIKIFPQDNQSVPELRFNSFTNDWEQRKLKNVAEFNPKSILPTIFEYVDLESVVGTEMISHRTERKNTAPSRAQRLAQIGDIFYQTVRPYQKNNYLFDKIENNYVFSTGYAQLRPYINPNFLMSFLQTENFVKVVLDNCTGTSYPAINSTDLSNLKLKIPKSQKEQEQIGLLFYNLDKTITLHQRKLDKLKEVKSALLDKLLV